MFTFWIFLLISGTSKAKHFKFGTRIHRGKDKLMPERLSLNKLRLWSRDLFNFR